MGLIQAIPHWPVDVVGLFDGKDDPRREGRSESSFMRYQQRHRRKNESFFARVLNLYCPPSRRGGQNLITRSLGRVPW